MVVGWECVVSGWNGWLVLRKRGSVDEIGSWKMVMGKCEWLNRDLVEDEDD